MNIFLDIVEEKNISISKFLDDNGVKSKMLTMKGNIVAAYKTNSGFKVAPYTEHYVNIVKVEENGKNIEYVIDSMFAEKPLASNMKSKLTPLLNDETCQYNVKLLKDYEDAIKSSIDRHSGIIESRNKLESATQAKEDYIKTILEFNNNLN